MFSVIVSIYQVEKYLKQCIESVLSQTYTDLELILVDDGSADNCPQICDEYATLDARIRVIHQDNGGLMSTRRAGVSMAKGEYVCFIDGDDFIQNDMLETYAKVLKVNKVDVICACGTKYFEDGRPTEPIVQRIPNGFYDKNDLRDKVYPQMLSTSPFYNFFVIPSVCFKSFRLEIAQQVYECVPNNVTLGEDAAATYPALLLADSVAVIDYYGYQYRQNLSSMTHSYDPKLHDRIRNLLLHLRNVEKRLKWGAGSQIDEYTIFLLILAKNNEVIFNKGSKYNVMKANMLTYLQDPLFAQAINNVKLKGLKNKLILWCFRKKAILPMYLWGLKNK